MPGEYLLWHENGSGWFDCASSHDTLAEAVEAAGKGWRHTRQRVTLRGETGQNETAALWDSAWPLEHREKAVEIARRQGR